MKIHRSITESRVVAAVKDEAWGTANPGFCLVCGVDHHYCEPDAREYECEECGERAVFGAGECLICGYYH